MRTMQLALSEIATKPSRIIATLLAIVIGVGFACAALVFTATFQEDLRARISAEYSGADVVVTALGDMSAGELARRIAAVPGVRTAQPLYEAGSEYTSEKSHGYLHLAMHAPQGQLQWADLVDGRWPRSSDEIVLSEDTSIGANLPIGAELALTMPWQPDEPDEAAATLRVTVVGIAYTGASPLMGSQPTGFVTPAALTDDFGATYATQIAVLATPGTDPAALAESIEHHQGMTVLGRTTSAQADHDIAMFTGQTTALAAVLLGFAFIAMVVAGIVIANTFTILLTQRRRQIALQRCVGATGAQVRRGLLAEAGLIGVLGAILGIGVGGGAGVAAASISGLDSGGDVVPMTPLAIVALIGIATTIGAALLPASRAMRVPPLAALDPVAPPERERLTSTARVVVGIVLVAFGGLLLALGVYVGSLIAAMPGGALSAVGVLLLTRSFLPPLLRLVGGIGSAAGVPGRLAAANAVRNPGRAAATSAALVVGVALIVMLQVAAASVGASVDSATAEQYPVDVSVAGDGAPLPTDVISGVKATPELAHSISLPGADATVDVPGMDDDDQAHALGVAGDGGAPSGGTAGGAARGGNHVTVIGIPADAATVVRGGLDVLGASGELPIALVPSWWVGSSRVGVGETIALTVDGESQQFTVAVSHVTEAGVARPSVMVAQSALDRLAPDAGTVVMWGALADLDDAAAAMSALNALVAGDADISVTGSAADRASLQEVLGTVTTVATGLLAVAVVIALLGIGNTIGLSVVERTRESALLRALGLRRRQLRLMLAFEALLLALIGALAGIALGLIYGWAGAATVFGQIGQELVFTVPWATVGLVLLIALAAGVLASVLPARRAAKAQPIEALAEE